MRQVQSLQSSEGTREETVTMFSPMFTTTNAGLSFAGVLVGFLAIHIAVKFIDLESSGEEVFVEIVFDADVIFFGELDGAGEVLVCREMDAADVLPNGFKEVRLVVATPSF